MDNEVKKKKKRSRNCWILKGGKIFSLFKSIGQTQTQTENEFLFKR